LSKALSEGKPCWGSFTRFIDICD